MKLKNKKTGEIGELQITEKHCAVAVGNGTASCGIEIYTSLAELNAEWEDAPEEPKEYWCIRENGVVGKRPYPIGIECVEQENRDEMREIGNYFETREESEKAVEKLKAWKRLKDRNLRFNLNYSTSAATINHKDVIMCRIEAYFDDKWEEDNMKAEEDLYLLLGGEE